MTRCMARPCVAMMTLGVAFAAAHVAGRRLQGAEDGETVEIVKGVSAQPDGLGQNVYAAEGQEGSRT